MKMCYVYNQWYDISCTTLYISNLNIKFNTITTFSFTFTSLSNGGDNVYKTVKNTVICVGRRGQFYCKQEYDTSLIHCLPYTLINQGYVIKNKTISKEEINSHKL